VLSPLDEAYSFYCGNYMVHKSLFHNVYIRLNSQENSSNVFYYWLVFFFSLPTLDAAILFTNSMAEKMNFKSKKFKDSACVARVQLHSH